MEMIQVAKPYFTDDDIDFITENTRDVLKSDMLMQGKWVREFEEAFAAYCGVRYARAVATPRSGAPRLLPRSCANTSSPGAAAIASCHNMDSRDRQQSAARAVSAQRKQ